MIPNPNTESTLFIQSLKGAGVAISNEREVIERLEEAREWHYAFTTLVKQGDRIGINFMANPDMQSAKLSAELQRVFALYRFPDQTESIFEARLLH
ncbi:MAG: hypothetical protein IV101_04550 [Dechloromonas sp.]|uniref:hypothetical protein n=1 Tax=Azonexaceae TaxID=2008795 RepID=UPI001CF92B2F|nr:MULTISPECIES: hypothetical protein [Azonexaceae]MBT9520144.1 hypothetical protein [Dechloromonas sp.]UCV24149.1 hypothetical protein KI613_06415 [Ferribacterium limneticum]